MIAGRAGWRRAAAAYAAATDGPQRATAAAYAAPSSGSASPARPRVMAARAGSSKARSSRLLGRDGGCARDVTIVTKLLLALTDDANYTSQCVVRHASSSHSASPP